MSHSQRSPHLISLPWRNSQQASVVYKQLKGKSPPLFKWALRSWEKSNSGDKLLCVPFSECPTQNSSLPARVGQHLSQPNLPLLWRAWQPTGWPASLLPSLAFLQDAGAILPMIPSETQNTISVSSELLQFACGILEEVRIPSISRRCFHTFCMYFKLLAWWQTSWAQRTHLHKKHSLLQN